MKRTLVPIIIVLLLVASPLYAKPPSVIGQPVLNNSAGLAAALSNETGTGAVVFGTAPSISMFELDASTAQPLTAAQVSGSIIYNTGQGPNDVNNTLVAAAAGYHFYAIVGEAQAANYWRFTASTTPTPDDFVCLDGTCGKLYVQIAAPTQGAALECWTAKVAATGLKASPGLYMGSTNTAVAHIVFGYDIAGTGYASAADAVGTAPGNDVIPQNLYGAVAFDIGTNGTLDAVEATANAAGYASAALAIAGLPAVEAAHIRIGTVTAMSTEVAGFTFGTDALNAANSTVAFTSTAAYSLPYNWVCKALVGTWATD